MFWSIELLYFVLMIAVFIVLLLWAKLPTGLALMASAVTGFIFSAIISGTAFDIRYLVEGMFGYFDTILVITTAMVFMGAMEACGALQYISTLLVKLLGRFPSLLLIAFMLIIMFPAMVTGSSLASAISAGALVAPIMLKWGIPKSKTGAIIAIGSVLGMVAPPVNVPAMVICDVVDIPYTGFTLPLLLLAFPLAIISVLLLGRKYVKPLSKEDIPRVVDVSILKELNGTVCIPMLVLIVFIVLEMIFPKIFGALAMPAMFIISAVICFLVGRRYPFFKKRDKSLAVSSDDKPGSVIDIFRESVYKSFSAMGLLVGVGMFMEIITLNGVRGYIVYIAISLPNIWQYVGMAVSLPLFGGISAFGSASMLGGPFVMALDGVCYSIMVTGGLSLLAALGEFSPPTAMSATFATNVVGEKSWTKVTKAALPALGVMFVYSVLYVLWFARIVQSAVNKTAVILIMFAVAMAVAIIFAVVWEILVRKVGFLKKYAHQVGAADVSVAVTAEETAEAEELGVQAEQAENDGSQQLQQTAEEDAGGSGQSGEER